MKTHVLFKVIITTLALLVALCIASLVILLIFGVKDDIFVKNDPVTAPPSTAASPKLEKTADYGQSYINSIVFLCDKSMSEIKAGAILKNGENTNQIWSGKDGDLALDFKTSTAHIVFPYTDEELSIPNALKETMPDYMVITLGINNGIRCSDEKFKEYYGKLITTVKETSPTTKIILQSIFPVSKNYAKSSSGVSIEKIDEANELIIELASAYGARYLDTASILKDSKGYLKPEYDSGNGLSLNKSGYSAVIEYVRTHGYK